MKSIEQQKQLKKYFIKYKIGSGTLANDCIEYLDDINQFIQRKLLSYHKNIDISTNQYVLFQIKLMLDVIKKLNEQMNLNCIVKKIIVLYNSINILSINKLFTQQIQKFIRVQINKILKEDIQSLFNKKRNSLNKIVGYIKEFSLSKQKRQVNYSRSKLQNDNEKGALKEIINKVIEPFCLYLLKILQDNNEYIILKRKNFQKRNDIVWKMINWSKCIGQIIIAIFKFSRYLKSDLTCIFLLITCLCSKDIGVYYDTLLGYTEEQAYQWKIKIQQYMDIIANKNPFHKDNISSDSQFLDLKGYIEQLFAIKQILLYLFGNKQFKSWSYYFYKPGSLKNKKNNNNTENFQYILNFSKKKDKEKKKFDSLKKIDKQTDKYMMLCQTEAVYSKQLFFNVQSNNTLLQIVKTEQIIYQELDYKQINPLYKKTRLNWHNSNQKEAGIRKNARLLVDQSNKNRLY